jgi:hypothetical protein
MREMKASSLPDLMKMDAKPYAAAQLTKTFV